MMKSMLRVHFQLKRPILTLTVFFGIISVLNLGFFAAIENSEGIPVDDVIPQLKDKSLLSLDEQVAIVQSIPLQPDVIQQLTHSFAWSNSYRIFDLFPKDAVHQVNEELVHAQKASWLPADGFEREIKEIFAKVLLLHTRGYYLYAVYYYLKLKASHPQLDSITYAELVKELSFVAENLVNSQDLLVHFVEAACVDFESRWAKGDHTPEKAASSQTSHFLNMFSKVTKQSKEILGLNRKMTKLRFLDHPEVPVDVTDLYSSVAYKVTQRALEEAISAQQKLVESLFFHYHKYGLNKYIPEPLLALIPFKPDFKPSHDPLEQKPSAHDEL